MNSNGLRPYKTPIFLLIFLNGSNRSVSYDFGKRQFKNRNFQASASGLPVVVELRPKSSKVKEISVFLNERSLTEIEYSPRNLPKPIEIRFAIIHKLMYCNILRFNFQLFLKPLASFLTY